MNPHKYFLPYQIEWLNDNSRVKIWEKSRRIGATYVQSYEDVRDCVSGKVENVWFSSADESAGKEYIRYCERWAKLFDAAVTELGEIDVVLESEEDIKAHVIEFANGARINALSSNPKSFRSKGGKVVLDEFAHHDNAGSLWTAANPCAAWEYPTRILSTHNGQGCWFYKFVEDIKGGKLNWSLHTTSIQLAVDQGLVDKIQKKETTAEERQEWLDELHGRCNNDDLWLQEYCCVAMDESTAFLPYELISRCELADVIQPLSELTGDIYVGMDIGRTEHFTVIWVLERLGNVNYTRMVKVLPRTEFSDQLNELYRIIRHKKFIRCCMDSTGMGRPLAEAAEKEFSKSKVEGINFSGSLKEQLAYELKIHFEGKTVYIPSDPDIRDDLHSVKKFITEAGHIRFDAEATEATGHADRFWALALALHAAKNKKYPYHIATRRKRETYKMSKGYWKKIDWSKYFPS